MAAGSFSRRRCFAWTLAIGAHAALLVALSVPLAPENRPIVVAEEAPVWLDDGRALRVELPSPLAPEALPPAVRRVALRPARRPRLAVDDRAVKDQDDPVAADALERLPSPLDAPVARPLSMFDDEGRALLPDKPLFSAAPPPREGAWHTPGDGSEDDVFDRPLALDPATTRFERVWAQPETLGSAWYGRLVRATTGIVRVPLNPKFTLVCGVSIAGLGGGCGIARVAGSGVVVERSGDPPPWERTGRVQCRELREQLAVAEDAERVAFLLDRLSALCIDAATPETTGHGETEP